MVTPTELEAAENKIDSEVDGFDVVVDCSGFPPAIEKVNIHCELKRNNVFHYMDCKEKVNDVLFSFFVKNR